MFNYNYNEVNPYYINNMLNLFLNKMSMFCNNTTYVVIDESKTQNRMIYSDSKIFTEDMLDSEMTDTLNEIKFYTIDYIFSYKLMSNRESYELKLYKDIVEMLSDKR